MIKNAYAAAGVPMLPVVRGDRETARQIVLYSVAMVAFTVVVGLWLGPLYTVAAVVLGAVFVALAVLLRRDLSRAGTRRCSSTTRSSTSRCSSPRLRSTRCSSDLDFAANELARRNLRFGWALFVLFWLALRRHDPRRRAVRPTRLNRAPDARQV